MSEQTVDEKYASASKVKQSERHSVDAERSTLDVWKEKLDVKLRPDEVKITAPDGSADFTAINEGGEMFISTHLTDGEGNRLSGDMPRYGEMFTAALDHFNKSGRAVDKIIGDWGGQNNTNLHEFVRAVGEQIGNPGITIQEIYKQQKDIPEAVLVKAALQAPTGKVVSKAGFGRPVVNVGRGDVQVLFEKQPSIPESKSIVSADEVRQYGETFGESPIFRDVQGNSYTAEQAAEILNSGEESVLYLREGIPRKVLDSAKKNQAILQDLEAGGVGIAVDPQLEKKQKTSTTVEKDERPVAESTQTRKVVQDLDTLIAQVRKRPDLYKAVETMPGRDREMLLEAIGKYMTKAIPATYVDESEARKVGATIDTRFLVSPAGIAIITGEYGSNGLITAELPEDNTQRMQAAIDAIIRWSELNQHNTSSLSSAMQLERSAAIDHIMHQFPWNTVSRGYYLQGLDAKSLVISSDAILQIAPAPAIAEEALALKQKQETNASGGLTFPTIDHPVKVIELAAGIKDMQNLERIDMLQLQQAAVKARNILRMNPNARISLQFSPGIEPIILTASDAQKKGAEITTLDMLEPLAENLSSVVGYEISGEGIDEAADEYQNYIDSLSIGYRNRNDGSDSEQSTRNEGLIAIDNPPEKKKGFLQRISGQLSQQDINYIVNNPQNFDNPGTSTKGWSPASEVHTASSLDSTDTITRPGMVSRAWRAIKRSHDRNHLGLSDKEMEGLTDEEKERKRQKARDAIADEHQQKITDDNRRRENLRDEREREKRLLDVRANIAAYGGDVTGLRIDMTHEELQAEQKRRIGDAHRKYDEDRRAKRVALDTSIPSKRSEPSRTQSHSENQRRAKSSPSRENTEQPNDKPNSLGTLLGAVASGLLRGKNKEKPIDEPFPDTTNIYSSTETSSTPSSPKVSSPGKAESPSPVREPFIDYEDNKKPEKPPEPETANVPEAPKPSEPHKQLEPQKPPEEEPAKTQVPEEKFELGEILLEGQPINSPTLDSLRDQYMRVSDVGEALSETDPAGAAIIAKQLERIQQAMMREYAKQQESTKQSGE